MYQVKLPYCRIMATMSATPFGVQEVDCPKVYDKPIPNKVIMRVDALEILHDRFDDSCFICRDILYALFSGSKGFYNCEDIFYSYYKKFASFRRVINDAYYYGNDSIPLFDRVVYPIRSELDKHKLEISDQLKNSGGKFLLNTHDYIYYAYPVGATIPDVIGGTKIC